MPQVNELSWIFNFCIYLSSLILIFLLLSSMMSFCTSVSQKNLNLFFFSMMI